MKKEWKGMVCAIAMVAVAMLLMPTTLIAKNTNTGENSIKPALYILNQPEPIKFDGDNTNNKPQPIVQEDQLDQQQTKFSGWGWGCYRMSQFQKLYIPENINDEKIVFKQSFNPFTGSVEAFFSDTKKGFKVYEDFWNVQLEICKVSWWGIPMHGSNFDGTPEDMSFVITFYDDYDGPRSSPPNQIIATFNAPSYQVDIQSHIEITISGRTYKFIQFAYGLPSPVKVRNGDGWISIQSSEDNDNDYFAWLASEDGDNFLYHEGGGGGKSSDVAFILYNINHAPSKPSRPSGPTSGKVGNSYKYSTVAHDSDGNKVKYGWDWDGDKKVDEWTNFYDSGKTIETSHSWDEKGEYEIRVKAKDEHGVESEWSDPLVVSMPKTISLNACILEKLSEWFSSIFGKEIISLFFGYPNVRGNEKEHS